MSAPSGPATRTCHERAAPSSSLMLPALTSAGSRPISRSMKRNTAPSSTYALFAQAMAERKQILCLYDGHPRALCPIILGHTGGQEMALVYQFAGGSKS